ncbi:unnamed protein product [Fraxinus pennsylvanica]|uniref:Major facilitator superfamily (MFS) profile domain-containing protein n=1 Tax=Fraxinus pennsylvanica TaxID=56036 RepID=A0AAD1YVG3_9LAMI|nr:unnamed protein product [Fraxinus pennsylvanica]
MTLSGVLTAFSANIWMYTALRFISGFGRSTIATCALVLSAELVGKKWRGNVGIIGFIGFPFGFLSLPGIAYLTKGSSWGLLYLWTCIPPVFYSVLLYFLACESPRYLYIKGRKEDFAKTLRSIAAPANRVLTDNFVDRCIKWEDELQETDYYSAIKMLLQTSWASRRLASVMVVGFGVSMIYFGMPLSLGNFAFDLYLSVALNAFIQIPAALIIYFLIGKLNMKFSVLGLAILSGICSVTCVLIRKKGMQIGLELISYFCGIAALDLFMIYTLELFLTCTRNSAVSMLRQAMMLGGVSCRS